MAPIADRTERKQLSKGQRKHVRRMKQEARKSGGPDNHMKKSVRAWAAPRE